MDARKPALLVALAAGMSLGATYRTPNFVVQAPTAEFAKQVGDRAEVYRRELAEEWLGYTLKQWWKPCPIHVRFDRGAGGVTSFNFDRGEVFGWNMEIQGPPDRLLDSVLPHEVTHTIFASHFRQPLPRWADEGACSTVEHPSERQRQNQDLLRFLRSGRSIRFSELFRMKQYPRDIHPLYAEGHSLCSFLLEQGGQRKFIEFLETGLEDENWTAAIEKHYGYEHLQKLQDSWVDWVAKGSRPLEGDVQDAEDGVRLASNQEPQPPQKSAYDRAVVRGQSQDLAADAGPLTPVGRAHVNAQGEFPSAELARDPKAWNPQLAGGGEPSGAIQDASGWRTAGADEQPFDDAAANDSGGAPAIDQGDVPPTERPVGDETEEAVADEPGPAPLSQAVRPQPAQSVRTGVVQWERAAEPADPRAQQISKQRLSESGRAVRFDATPRVIRR
jgi:hypothetical protein